MKKKQYKRYNQMVLILLLVWIQLFSTISVSAATKKTQTKTVTMVAVGDNLIHTPIISAAKQKNGTNDFSMLFRNVKKYVKKADIAVINQETIFVDGNYSGYPCFGSPKKVGKAIVEAGFDVVQHATNHTMDRGTSAITGTLDYWKKRHPEIKILGIHNSKKEASKITVVNKNGIKIAMLNYTYGLNGFRLLYGQEYLVDLLGNEKKIAADIKKAKKQADFVTVFVHFGTEYVYSPDYSQKKWTQFFADQGVDLMVGTHPHVLQPVKYVKGKNGNKMLAYYSLGNFASNQSQISRVLGGMAEITIVKDKRGTRIKSYDLEPLVTHFTPARNYYTVYKLSDYTDKLASKHAAGGVSVKALKQLFKSITGRNA